ncbi:MAG: DUF1573 domain-containing protein [Phycisphaerae bacterium]|nr:DUF1573 domain-containing protein [Phycisphaerae bacterium]
MNSKRVIIVLLAGGFAISACDSKSSDSTPTKSSTGSSPTAQPAPKNTSPTSAEPAPANPQPAQPTTAQPANLPQPAAQSGPRASTPETHYDFGIVWTGRTIIHPFNIRNDGEQPLRLTKPHAYCSCSTADAYSEVINPGEVGQVQYRLNLLNKSGPVNEWLETQTNDPARPVLRFEMTGFARVICELKVTEDIRLLDGSIPVEKASEVENARGDFGRVTTNQNLRRIIRMTNASGVPLQLELQPIRAASVSGDGATAMSVQPMFDAVLNPVEEGEVYDLTVVGKPPFHFGYNTTSLQFKTGIADYPVYTVNVYAFCPPRLEISPTKIVFNQQASNRQRKITIRNNGNTPLKVTSVATTDPRIRVTLLAPDPTKPNELEVEVLIPNDPSYLPPTYGEIIRIETTDEERPVIDTYVLPDLRAPATDRPADKPLQFTPGTMLQ